MPVSKKPRRKSLSKALDGDRSNNVSENLLLTCRNHHGQIEGQIIPQWEVMLKKTILSNPLTMERLGLVRQVSAVDMPAAVVAGDNHGVAAGNIGTVNFKSSKGSTRIAHPVGSIGADIPKKGYLEYLVRKYFEARGKGIKYGDKHLEKMKLECGKI